MGHKRKRPARGEALIYPGKADQHSDSTEATRLQFLNRCGISLNRAAIIAPLVFGEALS